MAKKYDLMSIWKLPPFAGQKVLCEGKHEATIIANIDNSYYNIWASLSDADIQNREIRIRFNNKSEQFVYLKKLIPVGIVEGAYYTVQLSNGVEIRGAIETVQESLDDFIILNELKIRKVFAYDQEWRNYYYKVIEQDLNGQAEQSGITELQGEMLMEIQTILTSTGGKTRNRALLPEPVLPHVVNVSQNISSEDTPALDELLAEIVSGTTDSPF